MANNYPYVTNDFLEKLFKTQQRVIFVRITSLDLDENPRETIEGRITQGNVNLDGKSSVRRSCSMTVATSLDTKIEDTIYWSLNTKIKIEIGLENVIDIENYEPTIWFPLGVFILSNFSYSKSATNYSIQLQGKDKMCLLNGDVSGEIYASVDFGSEDLLNKETNTVERVEIPIEDIIREGVREYAREPYHNIIIRDLPKYGLNLLEWANSNNLYVLISGAVGTQNEVRQAMLSQSIVKINNTTVTGKTLNDLDSLGFNWCSLNNFIDPSDPMSGDTVCLEGDSTEYYVAKVETGDTVGFEPDYLIYPHGEDDSGLTIGPGGTFTEILDKIVNFLGNYEYFYDVNGQFIFQKKTNNISTFWDKSIWVNNTGMGNDYSVTSNSKLTWNFNGEEIVTNFSDTPNINNIKNDYSIWGTRPSGDSELAIHLRYAIDHKPVYYKSIAMTAQEITDYVALHPEFKNSFEKDDSGDYVDKNSVTYYTYKNTYTTSGTSYEVDWREVIYQMARDYMRLKHFDQFEAYLDRDNQISGTDIHLYPGGITGYEQYYVDLEGFWRYLYQPTEYEDDERKVYKSITKEEVDTSEDIYLTDYWTRTAPAVGDELNWETYGLYYQNDIPILLKDPTSFSTFRYLGFNLDWDSTNNTWFYDYTFGGNNEALQFNDLEPLYQILNASSALTPGNTIPITDGIVHDDLGTGIYIDLNNGEDDTAITECSIDVTNKTLAINEYISFSQTFAKSGHTYVLRSDRYGMIVPIDEVEYEMSQLQSHEYLATSTSSPVDFYVIKKGKKYEEIKPYNENASYKVGDKCYLKSNNVTTYYKCKKAVKYGGESPDATGSQYWSVLPANERSQTIKYYIYDSGIHRVEVGSEEDAEYIEKYGSIAVNENSSLENNNLVRAQRFRSKLVEVSLNSYGISYVDNDANELDDRIGYVYRIGLTASSNNIKLGGENGLLVSRLISSEQIATKNSTIYKIYYDNIDSTSTRIVKEGYSDRKGLEEHIVTQANTVYDLIHDLGIEDSGYVFYKRTYPTDYYQKGDIYEADNWMINDLFYNYTDNHDIQHLVSTYNTIRVYSATGNPVLYNKNQTDPLTYDSDTIEYYQQKYNYQYGNIDRKGKWNSDIFDYPERLMFWFDFLESEMSNAVGKYGVNKIQQRSKVTSDDKASAIIYSDTYNIVWEFSDASPEDIAKYNQLTPYLKEAEYAVFKIPAWLKSSFIFSSKSKSCKDVLDDWLLNYTQANESLNFSALPIYTLQPNDLVMINNGVYRINSISMPLSYNGTMSVQATNVIDLYYYDPEDDALFKNLDFNATKGLSDDNIRVQGSNIKLFDTEENWNKEWTIELQATPNKAYNDAGSCTSIGLYGDSNFLNHSDSYNNRFQLILGTNGMGVDTWGSLTKPWSGQGTGICVEEFNPSGKKITIEKRNEYEPSGNREIKVAYIRIYVDGVLQSFRRDRPGATETYDQVVRRIIYDEDGQFKPTVDDTKGNICLMVGGIKAGFRRGFNGHLDYLKFKWIN